jgi:hypothetical protein
MRRAVIALTAALALGACAQLGELQVAVGTSVSPTQALVAANAFNAAESGATAYLVFCKTNLTTAPCSAGNRRNVITYVRAGRAARNQIETYVSTSSSVPVAIYNVMIAAVSNLRASPASAYTGAQ